MRWLLAASVLAWSAPVWSQAEPASGDAKAPAMKAANLDELLMKVKAGWKQDDAELRKREAEFLADESKQKGLLRQAKADLEALQKKTEAMEKEFDTNEVLMARLEETLRLRLGTMAELFGVIRQVAGEAQSQVDASLTAAQHPDRGDTIASLASSKGLPSISELQALWFVLQQEMTESGKVARFTAKVVTATGQEQEMEVVRVGVFNAFAGGKYLTWDAKVGKLLELARQPAERFRQGAAALAESKEGYTRVAVDPSRGKILEALVQTPDFFEQIPFGGMIGYITLSLGAAAFLLGLGRLFVLLFVGFRIRRQRSNKTIKLSNALGRILDIYAKNPHLDTETLTHKLDEAILRESAKLERYLWAVKIISVVAPLMGLLGTITGMITTFQSITMFGTGDPRLMAGGISEALVTTELGLIVAIPLVLLHSVAASMSRSLVEILEQQSTGLVARRAEQEKAPDGAAV
jgi:biopolymer transport protein ExbB